jgi:hypothetical protein
VMTDRLRRYPKAARNVSSVALLAIGVLALYNWVLAPHVGYLHAVQRLGPVVDRVTQERERICSTLDEKVGRWRTLQQELAELDEGVFTPDRATTFVRGLLPLVEETGCTVVRADFGTDAKTERFEEPNLPVVIEVSHVDLDVLGPPDRISALLRRLRDSRPRAWIDSCRYNFSGVDARQVECNLVLTLYTIVDREPPVQDPPGPVALRAQTMPYPTRSPDAQRPSGPGAEWLRLCRSKPSC